jgi:nucleoid DNA-binding protein
MTRRSLAYRLAAELQLDVIIAQKIIDAFISGIAVGLARGEPVRISGFGVFDSWSRSPHIRIAYDTARAKPIGPLVLPEQTVIRFSPEECLCGL